MAIMKNMLEFYLLVLVILIHLSLLLCTESTCVFDARLFHQYLPSFTIGLLTKFFNSIPISLIWIQSIAQFLLIGDVVLLIMWTLKLIKYLFIKIMLILFVSSLILAVIYLMENHTTFTLSNEFYQYLEVGK